MNFICKFRISEILISYVFFFVRKRNEEGGERRWNSDRFPVFVGDFMRGENTKKKRFPADRWIATSCRNNEVSSLTETKPKHIPHTKRIPKCCLFLEHQRQQLKLPSKCGNSIVKAVRKRMLSQFEFHFSCSSYRFYKAAAFRDPCRIGYSLVRRVFFLFVAEETSPYLSKIPIDHALRKAIYFAETRNEVKKTPPFFWFLWIRQNFPQYPKTPLWKTDNKAVRNTEIGYINGEKPFTLWFERQPTRFEIWCEKGRKQTVRNRSLFGVYLFGIHSQDL